jgi:tripartite-type tricarboxylate transporter receptor subunit TctC
MNKMVRRDICHPVNLVHPVKLPLLRRSANYRNVLQTMNAKRFPPRLAGAAVLALSFAAAPAHAQAYPGRPIRMIVPFAAGGILDIVARAVGERLNGSLGQQVVVDNRGGAAGAIGTEIAARAAPDGYTLLTGHIGTHAINASLYPKLAYDPVRDFAPITLAAMFPLGLFVHPSVPAHSVPELVALAKSKPGEINFASVGSGSPTHMAGEMLKAMARIDIVHVPYKGNAAALTDLLGGRVQMFFSNLVTAMPHARSGRLRVIAVSTAKRSQQAPELPTIAESGVPGYDVTNWIGMLAPAATPRAIVLRLNRDIVAILAAPDLQERFRAQGVDLAGSTPEAFAAFIRSELAKWRKVVMESGATIG